MLSLHFDFFVTDVRESWNQVCPSLPPFCQFSWWWFPLLDLRRQASGDLGVLFLVLVPSRQNKFSYYAL